ncbi:ParM/StbA family protein [Vibrio sp. SCSIO 43155]|uniref:ParM/StbA family protein n=1 Tax=Vibrio sp. SCSIO 43155 TaxID=2819099 RepID=UPI002074C2FA|nr:ParM/StbA family protein [Vibrio sp. SCSIO 43155]USD58546.1 ParM/StbA family protein [Vibrio sp. SCSIO 43155]
MKRLNSEYAVCDNGSDGIKARSGSVEVQFDSLVVEGARFNSTSSYDSGSYSIGDHKYTVVTTCESGANIATNNEGYQISNANLVLVAHAFKKLGLKGGSVKVVVTLPISTFFLNPENPEVNLELIGELKEHLMQEVHSLDDYDLPKVVDVSVQPEGIAAFAYATSIFAIEGERFAVADIGGTTTDIAIITKEGQIQCFVSAPIGTIEMFDNFAQEVSEAYALGGLPPKHLILKAFRGEKLAGIDVSEFVSKYKQRLDKNVRNALNQLANVNFLDATIFSGGGSEFLNSLKANEYRTDEPRKDNVNGMAAIIEATLVHERTGRKEIDSEEILSKI